jgi:NAD(P)-dependent dehydrogenase (short-subunit alcohol dehydrogenase family)
MSLYGLIKPKGPSGFGYSSTAEEVTAGLSLAGKTILVTGCNSGLGFETMRVLALRGARVLGAARTEAKAQRACAAVTGAAATTVTSTAATAVTRKTATGIACDLSDPASVRDCVELLKVRNVRLDVIICNAGIMRLPRLTQAHGYELQFFTNHIGHFMLVTGLLGALAENGRVVMLSSASHLKAPAQGIQFDNLSGEKFYDPLVNYGQSKFANILFAKELARRFAGTARTANAVHPGAIRTGLSRYIEAPAWAINLAFNIGNVLAFKTIPQGASTECYVAVNPGAATISGAYFANCNVAVPRSDANDPALAAKLWEVSERIVAGLSA